MIAVARVLLGFDGNRKGNQTIAESYIIMDENCGMIQ